MTDRTDPADKKSSSPGDKKPALSDDKKFKPWSLRLSQVFKTGFVGVVCAGLLVLATAIPQFSAVAESQENQGFNDPSAVQYVGDAPKQEVIYAKLTETGDPTSLYAVNVFEFDGENVPRVVTDYGTYSDVTNLSDDSEILSTENKTVFRTDDSSFSYQGDLTSTELPWLIDINYYVDGTEVAPTDLAGKSGHFGLEIKTQANPNADLSYFDNYLMQISCPLSSKNAFNVTTEDGSIALSGSDITVTFMGMPGKSGDFRLDADINDFEMDSITFAALPFSLSLDLPDTDELTSGFDQLVDGSQQLNQAADGLSDATLLIKQAAKQVNDGLGKLVTSAQELHSGIESYTQATQLVGDNLRDLAQGSNDFADNLSMLAQQQNALTQSVDELETGLQDLLKKYGSFLPADEVENLKGALDGVQGFAEYADNVKKLSDRYSSEDGINNSLERIASGLDKLNDQSETLVQGSSDFNEGLQKLQGGTSELLEGSEQVSRGTKQLASGTETFYQQTQELPGRVQDEIDSIVSDYDKSDYTPTSFLSERNSQVELVQFACMTPAISLPDAEEPAEAEEDETLLSRFLDLFS